MTIDRNLTFLTRASNDDLMTLCDIVTKDIDGSFRTTETLSTTSSYIRNYPDNIKGMLPELINEFRLFGGNSVLNFFRGEGPEYSEILRDVAIKCNVSFHKATAKDEQVELMLLSKLIKDALNGASDDELRQLMDELDIFVPQFNRRKAVLIVERLWKSGSITGFMLLSSVISSILTRLTGLELNTAAEVKLSRLSAILLGPAGLILMALYSVFDFAGPAYRVTIPAVIQIAYIRQKIKQTIK